MKTFVEMTLDSVSGRRVLLNAHCVQQVVEEKDKTLKIVLTDGSTWRAGCAFDDLRNRLKEAVE